MAGLDILSCYICAVAAKRLAAIGMGCLGCCRVWLVAKRELGSPYGGIAGNDLACADAFYWVVGQGDYG